MELNTALINSRYTLVQLRDGGEVVAERRVRDSKVDQTKRLLREKYDKVVLTGCSQALGEQREQLQE